MSTTVLGVVAGGWAVLMAVSPALQIREIHRRRSSEGLSLRYLAVLLVGFVLWFAYGIARRELPLIVPNLVAFAVMAVTLGFALRYRD